MVIQCCNFAASYNINMTTERKWPGWVIRVFPRTGIYWPYTGASSYLGSYDSAENKGLATGLDQHQVVSSLPVKREDMCDFQIFRMTAENPCRLQIDLRFDTDEEARKYIKDILEQI